jgi:hypothetical protein
MRSLPPKRPAWGPYARGRPPSVGPAESTRFELQLQRLGLNGNPQEWYKSRQLKFWVERNRHKRYVPESLLLRWKMKLYECDVSLY